MRKMITIFAAAAVILGITAAAAGVAGKQSDPLVSFSYLNDTYLQTIVKKAQNQAKSALNDIWTQKQEKLNAMDSQIPGDTQDLTQMVADQMAPSLEMKSVTAASGSSFTMPTGCQFFLSSGTASLSSGSAVDLTAGTEATSTIAANHLYLIPESKTAKLNMNSSGTLYIGGSYTMSQADVWQVTYTKYADALHQLGLFQGTNQGYDLDRKSTRIEGLVMLVRLMGEEDAAKAYTGKHPFQDVPAWADRYVAYAYDKGYTNGSSATTFGPSDLMTGNQYLTFLLRALGYDDSAGDFVWSSAVKTAASLGVLSAADQTSILRTRYFYRDHIVYTSYKALIAKKKGGIITLATALVQNGVFTQSDWSSAQKIILG